jgi:hypothetical protein
MAYSDDAKVMVERAWLKTRQEFIDEFKDTSLGSKSAFRPNGTKLHKDVPSYETYLDQNKNLSFFPKPSEVDNRLLLLADCLNYVQMSKDLAADHHLTYVTDKQTNGQPEDVEVLMNSSQFTTINKTFDRLMGIMQFWEHKATNLANFKQLSFAERQKALRMNRYVIIGKPGIGKTALLNYLFSIRAYDLRKGNILWIRVSLNSVEDGYLELKDRLHSKFIKIFCKFYLYADDCQFGESFLRQLETYLLDKVCALKTFSRLSQDQKIAVVQAYVDLLNSVSDTDDEKLDAFIPLHEYALQLIHFRVMTEHTLRYIQYAYGYAYIFMFDGLDSATVDFIRYNAFQKWMEEIGRVTNTNNDADSYKAVYVLTMRDYSFVTFYLRHVKASRDDTAKFILLSVQKQPLASIVEKKCELAVQRLRKEGYSYSKEAFLNASHNLMRLTYSVLENGVSDASILGSETQSLHFTHFMNLNNDNVRAVMRFFRELLIMAYTVLKDNAFERLISNPSTDAFVKGFRGREWIVFRVLLHGDCAHGVYRNRVSYNAYGEATISTNNKAVIPNIFNYRDYYTEHDTHLFPKALVKTRIVQYLEKHGNSQITDVIRRLNEIFGYDTADFRFETREMIYNGLISPLKDEVDVIVAENKQATYYISLTDLARNITRRIMKRSIYYETVYDDTPIQDDFKERIVPLSRYDKNVPLDMYIIKKSRYIMFFLHYLMKIEAAERNRYMEINKCEEMQYVDMGYEVFSEEVVASIKADICGYLSGYMSKVQHEQGKDHIANFKGDWYKEFQIRED